MDKRDVVRDAALDGRRLAGRTPQQSLRLFFDLNESAGKIFKLSILAENPGISERKLIEMMRAIEFRGRHEIL